MITAWLVVDATPLTAEEKDTLSGLCEWVVLNRRNGRVFIDMNIRDKQAISSIRDVVKARNPKIIGVWTQAGKLVAGYLADLQEYKQAAPDKFRLKLDKTFEALRPTAFEQTHKWAGWPDKEFS